jgi:uncharacterized protein (TIGR02246 family)
MMSVAHTMQDEVAIREVIKDLQMSWNKADGYAFARVFTEDSEFRTIWGDKVNGRTVIGQGHQQLFDGALRGSRIELEIAGIRLLRPDVVYAEIISRLQHPSNPFLYSIVTLTLVKANDEWRVVTFNNAGILPRPEQTR